MDNNIKYSGWEIVREIGTGSYGSVYEIKKQNSFGSTENSALKVISIPPKTIDIESYTEEMGLDQKSFTEMVKSQMERITTEFKLMSELKGNSNIVSYEDHHVVQHDDGIGWDIYIRMELLTPLTEYLKTNYTEKNINIDEKLVAKIGVDICKALQICEKHHIVHRDIKPQNIFVNKDGNFKLGDFGIAKSVENASTGTKTGTFSYMAPEVFNNKKYSSSVDVYSLGLVMYWLLNERRGPFLPLPPQAPTASDVDEALNKRMNGVPFPKAKNGGDEINRIIAKAACSDPKKRYQNASEMLNDLTAFLHPVNNVAKPNFPKATPVKSKVKDNKPKKNRPIKKIILISVSILLVLSVCIIIPVSISNAKRKKEYQQHKQIMDNRPVVVEMLCGEMISDSSTDKTVSLSFNNSVYDVICLPVSFSVNPEHKDIIILVYKDKYEETYTVYGNISLNNNLLTISAIDDQKIDNAFNLQCDISYKLSILYHNIAFKYEDFQSTYHNSVWNDESKSLVLSGGLSGTKAYKDIKSVDFNNSGSTNQCVITFGDGSFTNDAVPSYTPDSNYLSIKWEKKTILYNGRQETSEGYDSRSLFFINNYPYGFTILDSETTDYYLYQNPVEDTN